MCGAVGVEGHGALGAGVGEEGGAAGGVVPSVGVGSGWGEAVDVLS